MKRDAESIYEIQTTAPGAAGALPLTEEMLLTRPSGDVFGLTQDAGMGWDPVVSEKSLSGGSTL